MQGAQARAEAQSKMMITAGYLAGMLTHCDPKNAPKLDDILGESKPDSKSAPVEQEVDPRINARRWMAFMDGLTSKKRKRKAGGNG